MYLGFAGFIPEIRDRKLPLIKGASHNANADKPEELNRFT